MVQRDDAECDLGGGYAEAVVDGMLLPLVLGVPLGVVAERGDGVIRVAIVEVAECGGDAPLPHPDHDVPVVAGAETEARELLLAPRPLLQFRSPLKFDLVGFLFVLALTLLLLLPLHQAQQPR